MAGLLDFMQSDDARFGLGLLAAAGPSQLGFGQRLQGALSGFDEYKKDQARGKYFDTQAQMGLLGLQKAQREAEQERAIQDAARQSFLSPEQAAGLSMGPMPDGSAMPQVTPGFDPRSFLSRLQTIDPFKAIDYEQKLAKDTSPISVAAGTSLIDRKTLRPIYTAPKEQELPSDVRSYQFAQSQGYKGSFTDWQLDQKKAGASKTVVAPVFKQEGEEAKAVGKFFGENYAEVQKAGMSAQGALNRYNRLGQLLEGVDTGKFAPLGLEAAKIAREVGLNIDPKLANKEAAVALSSEIALQLRNPAGGAGMPGAMSDADRNFLQGMVPGIEKTPEGRKTILETAKKLAQRDAEVARMARQYRQKNGTINEGFYDELARFSEANPLFKGAPSAPAGGGSSSNIDALLKKYGG